MNTLRGVLLIAILLFPAFTHSYAIEQGRNPAIVIAQLNLWFNGKGPTGGFEAYDGSGKPIVRLRPLLGKYSSNDPKVIYQQIEWAANYGVDAFSIEWFSPRERPGSIEKNLDEAFLKAPNLCKIRWCIFYDFVLRLFQAYPKYPFKKGIDFDKPNVRETFIQDFIHFSEKYFSHPQYLALDERPVVYIWGAWMFKGHYAAVVQEARREARKRGYDVYIAAEVVRSDSFDKTLAITFDANTSFIPFLVPGSPGFKNIGATADFIENTSRSWKRNISNLRVRERSESVSFQSSWTPQVDNRLYIKNNQEKNFTVLNIPALGRNQTVDTARIALKYSAPAGKNNQKIIWVNTYNNWAETTTVEPTASVGSMYPGGNYRFDMLQVIQSVFGPETFACSNSSP